MSGVLFLFFVLQHKPYFLFLKNMTKTIKQLIESCGALICPSCNGEGEAREFCGHYVDFACETCDENGIIKSTKLVTYLKTCLYCGGRGCRKCDDSGYMESEKYELFDINSIKINQSEK